MQRLSKVTALAGVVMILTAAAVSAQTGTSGRTRRRPQSEPSEYTLTVETSPDNASVSIDDLDRDTKGSSFSLEEGTYTVRVRASGYQTMTKEVTLDRDRTVVATLEEQEGTIRLNFPDRTANVFYVIDGNRSPVNMRGKREEISLSPGSYTFQYNAGGIDSPEFEIEISAGETVVITPSLQLDVDTRD